MEDKNMLDLAFFFNENLYAALSDQAKMDLLLMIDELVDKKMKELITNTPNPKSA